ncbi:hypothetical protein [Actinomadura sediminis]|uniref:hypothetical protein n=1 Tax=Actinomadura sediminis TaxID=1038904 RepID=UPI00366B5660
MLLVLAHLPLDGGVDRVPVGEFGAVAAAAGRAGLAPAAQRAQVMAACGGGRQFWPIQTTERNWR